MKNIESSSIVVQWDAVDDSLTTVYIIQWTRAGGGLQATHVTEQTSYTITGLALDTVYTITVSAANRCGSGVEFSTSITLSTDVTSTTSSINPIVTANTNPMSISSTADLSSSIATILKSSNSTITATAAIIKNIIIPTYSVVTTVSRVISTATKTINIKDITSERFSINIAATSTAISTANKG